MPPTCTEIGWKAYKACENCDYTTTYQAASIRRPGASRAKTCLSAGTIPDYTVHNHDLVHHEAKADLHEIGYEAYTLRLQYLCGTPIDPDNHDLVHRGQLPARAFP